MLANQQKFYQIDAFTRVPFKGNPAAVLLLDRPMRDEQLQNIALEMNLSETAFLWRRSEDQNYDLRWFTPEVEVDLCGHATIASAFMLYTEGHEAHANKLCFHTKSGVLKTEKRDAHIVLELPEIGIEQLIELTKNIEDIAKDAAAVYFNHNTYFFEYSAEKSVVEYQPDFVKIGSLDREIVIISAPSENNQRHFVSRVFAPRLGINEDPVTGSAHAILGPFWMGKFGKDRLIGEQVSKRSGVVNVMREGERFLISGLAVTTLKGLLVVQR